MAKAAIILANGFEEVEAFTPFDVLKRGSVDVSFVALHKAEVTSTHGAVVHCEKTLGEFEFSDCDMIILPGGLPGAQNLADSTELRQILQNFANKYCAAICAAPMALASAGLISSPYTCYPGFENNVSKEAPSDEVVVINGKIITSQGPATAFDFAFVLLELLTNKAVANEVAKGMLFK